jgi:peptide/nickel transport system permease protein
MLSYILRRVLAMVPTLLVISMVSFVIIQLPPGNFVDSLIANVASTGETVDRAAMVALVDRYGLDQPLPIQYLKWIGNILLRGDFGRSFAWNEPVAAMLWDRMALTVVLSFSTLIFTWIVALPVGIYSAVRQYSPGDYSATVLGYLGLAVPEFLSALVLMYIAFKVFNQSVGGLFSPDMAEAPWSFAKVLDMLSHLWIPMIILGTAGTASLIRVMRANLLDELHKPYVMAARARGLREGRLLLHYPVRIALNPFVSTVGWSLPYLVSGSVIVSVVLSLPTSGPLLLRALLSQDMYLAGGFILMLSSLTVAGTLISDILLALLDPRIRYR